MKFGCVLPNRGELAYPERLQALTVLAENLGYHSLWLSDHIVIPNTFTSKYPYTADGSAPFTGDTPYCEVLTILAYLAGFTSRIKLGTHVLILPYRNPVYAAKIISTLDFLSNGRVILGVGVGWLKEEFQVLGEPRFDERGLLSDEYIRLFKELWAKKEVDFKGKYYQISDVSFSPRSTQKPSIPIWVGGHTRAAIRRAATLGDAWLPIGLRGTAGLEPGEMREKVAMLRKYTQEEGRNPTEVQIAFSTNIVFNENLGSSRRLLNGTSEQIKQDIRTYQDIGVDYLLCDFRTGSMGRIMDAMERFSREVAPSFVT